MTAHPLEWVGHCFTSGFRYPQPAHSVLLPNGGAVWEYLPAFLCVCVSVPGYVQTFAPSCAHHWLLCHLSHKLQWAPTSPSYSIRVVSFMPVKHLQPSKILHKPSSFLLFWGHLKVNISKLQFGRCQGHPFARLLRMFSLQEDGKLCQDSLAHSLN